MRIGSAFTSIETRLKAHDSQTTERHTFYDLFPKQTSPDQKLKPGQLGWWHELKVRVPLSLKMDDFWKVFDKDLFSTSHSFRSQYKNKRSKPYDTRIHPSDPHFKHAIIYGFEVLYMLLSSSDSLQNRSAGFEKFFVLDKGRP